MPASLLTLGPHRLFFWGGGGVCPGRPSDAYVVPTHLHILWGDITIVTYTTLL